MPPYRVVAMEEFDEVEVLWPEYYACHAHAEADHKPLLESVQSSRPRRAALSRPVDVPVARAVLLLRWKDGTADDLEDNSGGGGAGKILVPPHLLVSGRRLSNGESTTTAAASTVLRSGRQHQHRRARDLRHLRNSVLRMIGFIEG